MGWGGSRHHWGVFSPFGGWSLIAPPSPQLACECYALLPALGRGFALGLRHREGWNQEVRGLLGAMRSLLGGLLPNGVQGMGGGVGGDLGALRGGLEWV